MSVAVYAAAQLLRESARPAVFSGGVIGIALDPPPRSVDELPSVRVVVEASAAVLGECPSVSVRMDAQLSDVYFQRLSNHGRQARMAWALIGAHVVREEFTIREHTSVIAVPQHQGGSSYAAFVDKRATRQRFRSLWLEARLGHRRTAGSCWLALPELIGTAVSPEGLHTISRDAAELLNLKPNSITGVRSGEVVLLTSAGTMVDRSTAIPPLTSSLSESWSCSVGDASDTDQAQCAAVIATQVAGFDHWKQFLSFVIAAVLALGIQMAYDGSVKRRHS
jgi:hypothetical protein